MTVIDCDQNNLSDGFVDNYCTWASDRSAKFHPFQKNLVGTVPWKRCALFVGSTTIIIPAFDVTSFDFEKPRHNVARVGRYGQGRGGKRQH